MVGKSKVMPELAAQQHTYFESEDHFLACSLHDGINCGSVDQIQIVDTLLSTYQGAGQLHGGE